MALILSWRPVLRIFLLSGTALPLLASTAAAYLEPVTITLGPPKKAVAPITVTLETPSAPASNNNITAGPSPSSVSSIGTTVNPVFQGGTLRIDTNGQSYGQNFTVDASGTNVIDQSGNRVTFTGTFSDTTAGSPGGLIFRNSGTGGDVTMTGASTYTGRTVIESGALLRMNGSIGGNGLDILSGGTLRGTGTISAPTVVSGTLAPGNSPGTLTFTAPVTQSAGSTLAIDIDGKGTGNGAGNYSRVVVLGAANSFTAAGTVQPILRGISGSATNSFTPSYGDSFSIVSADGGVRGTFLRIAQPAAGLPANSRFDLLYGANTVRLVVTPADFARLDGLTPNQKATGAALQAVRDLPALSGAMGQLYGASATGYAAALTRLGAPVYGDALMAGLGRARSFGSVLEDQLAARRGGAAPLGQVSQVRQLAGITGWITVLGDATRLGGEGNSGASSSSAGLALGGDRMVGSNLRLGFAAAFTEGRTAARGTGGTADGITAHLGVYGGWTLGRFFLDAQAFGSYQNDRVRRDLGEFGTASTRADSFGGSGALEAGIRYDVAGFVLQPSASIRVDHLSRNRTTEMAGPLGLAVNGANATSARAGLNLRAERAFSLAGRQIIANARVGYAHEMADRTTQTDAGFLVGSPDFRVTSARTGRDAALVGTGVTVPLGQAVSLYANYNAEMRSNYTGQSGHIGLRMSF